jgi:hypothetical protein
MKKRKKRKKQRKAPVGHVGPNTLDTEWFTPPEILDPVRDYFGGQIPFDPASDPSNPTGARRFLTQEDDGLTCAWEDQWFCNPPYGAECYGWLERFQIEAYYGSEGIAVLGCSRWENHFMQHALAGANVIYFPQGRVGFIRAATGDQVKGHTYATMVLGINVRAQRFARAFGSRGLVIHTMPLNDPPPAPPKCRCTLCLKRRKALAPKPRKRRKKRTS